MKLLADPEFLNAYGLTSDQARVAQIFFPHALQKRYMAFHSGTRFVHYTSAEAATAIIKNKCVWLRNVRCMNDFTEVDHGHQRLVNFFASDKAKLFWQTFDELSPGLSDSAKSLYDGWRNDLRCNTYITCVSEHDGEEDTLGRLSMWRAYGKNTGVALVLNGQAFHNDSQALHVYGVPILYQADDEVEHYFRSIMQQVSENKELLRPLSTADLSGHLFEMLSSLSLLIKHPGFKEEREWRAVYRPLQRSSARMVKAVETVNGLPQLIYKMPLQDVPEERLRGMSLHSLIDRVIIGPTQYPTVLRDAFIHLLDEAGVCDASNKVVMSDVPLRT